MLQKFLLFFSLILASFLPFSHHATTIKTKSIGNLNKIDLDFIYKTIIKNHPGVYDKANRGFSGMLWRNYRIAMRKLIKSREKESEILYEFVKSFNDGHVCLIPTPNNKNQAVEEKGKVARKFSLNYINDEQSNQGLKIAWIKLPTFKLNKQEENAFEKMIPEAKKVKDKIRDNRLKAIVFDLRGNRGGNSKYGRKLLAALFGDEQFRRAVNFGESELFIDWRASPREREAEDRDTSWRRGSPREREAEDRDTSWRRGSQGNLEHIIICRDDEIKSLRSKNVCKINLQQEKMINYFEKLQFGFLQSIFGNKPYFREYQGSRSFEAGEKFDKMSGITSLFSRFKPTQQQANDRNAGQGQLPNISQNIPKIIIIIGTENGSAATIFIDELQMIAKSQNLRLTMIGTETARDETFYTEVRRVELPSKRATLIFPTKVFRGKFKRNPEGYFYKPDVYFCASIADKPIGEKLLKKEVFKILENK